MKKTNLFTKTIFTLVVKRRQLVSFGERNFFMIRLFRDETALRIPVSILNWKERLKILHSRFQFRLLFYLHLLSFFILFFGEYIFRRHLERRIYTHNWIFPIPILLFDDLTPSWKCRTVIDLLYLLFYFNMENHSVI